MEKKKNVYFEEALSDFTHDAASGGAIRHMTDLGYTTEQIMQNLDFPTSRERVEKTILKYMLKTGLLLEELPLPESALKKTVLENVTPVRLSSCLTELIQCNGEENSYLACPFGTIRRDREIRLGRMFSCLTSREKDYLMGIPWEMQMMYHRLNSRMREIGTQLALHTDTDWNFYFLKSREILSVSGKGSHQSNIIH